MNKTTELIQPNQDLTNQPNKVMSPDATSNDTTRDINSN